MLGRDSVFSVDAITPNRDAIDGFSAIAAALDQGLVAGPSSSAAKLADAIAIGLGWLALVTFVLYPALQLAAIGACACFMVVRSLLRRTFAIFEPSCPRSPFSERSVLTGQLLRPIPQI
jgi:hypothetical protein